MSWAVTEPPCGLRITIQMKPSTPSSARRTASGSATEPWTYSMPSWRRRAQIEHPQVVVLA